MDDPTQLRILEMLEAHRDGELSPEEREELNELLATSPEARRYFVREQMLSASLNQGGTEALPLEPLPRPPQSGKRSPIALQFALCAGFAAVLATMLWLAFGQGGAPAVDAAEVAVLQRVVGASWGGETSPPEVGEAMTVTSGPLVLEGGTAQLQLYSGARVIIEGPAEFELLSADTLFLHYGRIRARIGEEAKGITLRSPHFELVDLGTEFGVDLKREGDAEIHVMEGLVEVRPSKAGRTPAAFNVEAGSGIVWERGELAGKIAADPSGFLSFEDVAKAERRESATAFQSWEESSRERADDPRIVAFYDFEPGSGGQLLDRAALHHGEIEAAESGAGRWPEKGALQFGSRESRVSLSIPDELRELTLTTWVRIDQLEGRYQGLLMSRAYTSRCIHWQLTPEGRLSFGTLPGAEAVPHSLLSEGGITPGQLRKWRHLATTVDTSKGLVVHYLDGEEIGRGGFLQGEPLVLGAAEIGNWEKGKAVTPDPNRELGGAIDELILWRGVLDGREIRGLFESGAP